MRYPHQPREDLGCAPPSQVKRLKPRAAGEAGNRVPDCGAQYLEWGEGHTGGRPRGAVADGGLPSIHHTLLLQRPLWKERQETFRLDLGSPAGAPSALGPPRPGLYLQRLGDPGFGGLVHLRLPYTPAA